MTSDPFESGVTDDAGETHERGEPRPSRAGGTVGDPASAAGAATLAKAASGPETTLPQTKTEATPVRGGPAPRNGGGTGAARVLVDGRPLRLAPHNCFACGSLNVAGLQLVIHIEGNSCWTELELPVRFEGWEGIAHGGILCTILDEVMAWSLVGQDTWGLTARMTVEFKRPVRVGTRLRAEGRVTRTRRRLATTEALLRDASNGEVLATAEALYVEVPPDSRQELKRRYGFDDGGTSASPGGGPAA